MLNTIDEFLLFRDHCINIRRDYNTYNQLFFSEHDEILIKTARSFFYDISEIMQRDWILQVCKIMETKEDVTKIKSLTLQLLNYRLEKDSMMTDSIIQRSNQILSYGKIIKPIRNKMIAHFDRKTALNGCVLGMHDEQKLDDFLKDIQSYCDEVGKVIGIGPLDFSASGCSGDVLDLLKILKTHCNKFGGPF